MTAPPYRTPDTAPVALGSLLATYGPSKLAALRSAAILGALLLVSGSACASSIDGMEGRPAGQIAVALLVGMVGCMAALGLLARAFAHRGMELELREHGLAYRAGRREIAMLWDDVAEVRITRRALRRWELDRCLLVGKDGRRLELNDHLRGIGPITSRVEEESLRRHLPWSLADIDAGRTVVFGPFAVDGEGLSHGSRRLPWNAVAGATVMGSILAVGDRDRGIRVLPKRGGLIAWAKERYADVPNAAVFLVIVAQRRGRP